MDNHNLTEKQLVALRELVADQGATASAWIIKEKLRWIRRAPTARGLLAHHELPQCDAVAGQVLLKPMVKALNTLERHADQVVRLRYSDLTNARLKGMNGLFQAARSRARGYRNESNFIAMIYLIGSPVGRMLDEAKSTCNVEEPKKGGSSYKTQALHPRDAAFSYGFTGYGVEGAGDDFHAARLMPRRRAVVSGYPAHQAHDNFLPNSVELPVSPFTSSSLDQEGQVCRHSLLLRARIHPVLLRIFLL